tara:strand:+ start:979 stop:2358 length:1380 start_codon:yes stop_codon:yes gene_type:complete
MSDYLDDAEAIKKKLDSVSESFCLAKWQQTSLHLTNGYTNSCYHPPLHKIDATALADNPSALHNTEHKKQSRKEMLEGVRPSDCSYCWNIEDQGSLSDRHYRSGEPWAAEKFDEILEGGWEKDVNPSYMEVNFSNACNLKCSYCSPQFSSTWMQEINQHGAYPTSNDHNHPSYFSGERKPIPVNQANPYVDAFWKWWPEVYPELKHFRMTGGEPLMDKNTYKIFDYVLENPKPDLHLNVTSNFSVDDGLFNKYIEYVKRLCDGENIEHFMQFVSIDAFGPKAEYIRNGLDFNRFWDNVNRYLTDVPTRNSITFIITMNNLSITSLRDLLNAIYGLREIYSDTYQRVWFDVPLLYEPTWQSLQILPESYQNILKDTIEYCEGRGEEVCEGFTGFKDYELNKLKRDWAWMKQPLDPKDKSQRLADFYKFFSEHDRRRNTTFLETFPEMKEFWYECEYHASN